MSVFNKHLFNLRPRHFRTLPIPDHALVTPFLLLLIRITLLGRFGVHRSLSLVLALSALMVAAPFGSNAQVVLPTATPINTATPVPVDTPTPTPTPSPAATPGGSVVAGLVDLSAYWQLRRPTSASIAIAFPASTPSVTPMQNAVSGATNAPAPAAVSVPTTALIPQLTGGVFSTVNLGAITGTTLPPAATVSLQFDPSNAGSLVWVQALDGGTLQAQGTDGPVTVQEGFWVEIDSAGHLSFTFQAPASSARYQVFIRLDNVSTVLPFVVPESAPST